MKTKISKRIFAVVLTVVMLLSAVPVGGLVGLDLFGITASAVDYKVGDIVEFGSYPQTKVTDSDILSALNSIISSYSWENDWTSYDYYSGTGSTGTMKQGDWMKYVDVTYNDNKYRAVKFTQYRPYHTEFISSTTWQYENGYSTNTEYWFKYEPLRWRVLDPSSGLVLSETCIDAQAYSNTGFSYNGKTWNDLAYTHYANDYATSSIREWLNDDFYNTAFNSTQQANMAFETLNNHAMDSEFDSSSTTDKIFLLSWDEVRNTEYGFSTIASNVDIARMAKSTDYAKAQGCNSVKEYGYSGNARWLLRTPGEIAFEASAVDYNGKRHTSHADGVSYTCNGIRPAIKLSQISSLDNDYYVGSIVEFGSYPQSEVKDSSTLSALNSLISSYNWEDDWTSYRFYSSNENTDSTAQESWGKYVDLTYCGNRYRAVRFTKYRAYQEKNGYTTNSTYWFKYEPLRWRVLNPSTGFVLSETCIDAQAYCNTVYYYDYHWWNDSAHTHYANDYATSSIRKWLNNDFFNTAFNLTQQKKIAYTTIYTANSRYANYSSGNTIEKVFLISYDDVSNSSYGFSSVKTNCDFTRISKSTDYAKSQGCDQTTYSSNFANAAWIVRPDGNDSGDTYHIVGSGQVITQSSADNNAFVGSAQYGIRPAMRLSDLNGAATMDNDEYTMQHSRYAEMNHMNESFGFYNKVWKDEISDSGQGKRLFPLKLWEALGDLGELATLKFDDLMISADYYELYLADLVTRYNQAVSNSSDYTEVFKLYRQNQSGLKKMLKSSDEWDSFVADGCELDLDGFLLDPDYELTDYTNGRIQSLLKSCFCSQDTINSVKDKAKEVFKGTEIAGRICDYISAGADIVSAFQDANKAYNVAQLFKEQNESFFSILYSAADKMSNKKLAGWFRAAIKEYDEATKNDVALFDSAIQAIEDLGYVAYDVIFRSTITNLSYTAIAGALEVSAGSIAILTFTYNFTYGILDRIFKMGDLTTPYYIMNYIAPVEQGLCEVEDVYSTKVQNELTYQSAVLYHEAFNILKCTNQYLYQAAYNFVATQGDKHQDDMEVLTMCSDAWNNAECCSSESSGNRKYISVQCPVDVVIRDQNDEIVLQIENEEVNVCDNSLTLLLFNGKKSIVCPSDKGYSIEITPREDGSLSYYVAEIEKYNIERNIDFYDIPIETGNTLNGSIPTGTGVEANEYSLSTGETTISCDYDSDSSECSEGGHSFGEWVTTSNPGKCEYGQKTRKCSVCGKEEGDIIPAIHDNIEYRNSILPTCTESGYEGNIFCADCGEFIDKGNDLNPSHTPVVIQGKAPTCAETGLTEGTKCSVCGETLTEQQTIPATNNHADNDHNGRCDSCDRDNTQGCDCRCHKDGFAGFIYKIIRIFWKLFRTRQICDCGISHY